MFALTELFKKKATKKDEGEMCIGFEKPQNTVQSQFSDKL
jgi:hypothetical protein